MVEAFQSKTVFFRKIFAALSTCNFPESCSCANNWSTLITYDAWFSLKDLL